MLKFLMRDNANLDLFDFLNWFQILHMNDFKKPLKIFFEFF